MAAAAIPAKPLSAFALPHVSPERIDLPTARTARARDPLLAPSDAINPPPLTPPLIASSTSFRGNLSKINFNTLLALCALGYKNCANPKSSASYPIDRNASAYAPATRNRSPTLSSLGNAFGSALNPTGSIFPSAVRTAFENAPASSTNPSSVKSSASGSGNAACRSAKSNTASASFCPSFPDIANTFRRPGAGPRPSCAGDCRVVRFGFD